MRILTMAEWVATLAQAKIFVCLMIDLPDREAVAVLDDPRVA
jgi:hypothetical protein